jgi:hypothetical protein
MVHSRKQSSHLGYPTEETVPRAEFVLSLPIAGRNGRPFIYVLPLLHISLAGSLHLKSRCWQLARSHLRSSFKGLDKNDNPKTLKSSANTSSLENLDRPKQHNFLGHPTVFTKGGHNFLKHFRSSKFRIIHGTWHESSSQGGTD